MTEDYKKNILNYITNMVNGTAPTTDEIFAYQESIDRSKWSPYLPNSWYAFKFEGLIAPNENTSNLTIIYGGYITEQATVDNAKGIIMLLDDNFIPVKTFYSFSSGTPLRYIQQMEQAEDGTFYFVDDTNYAPNQNTLSLQSQKRFVMVNNFSVINTTNNDYEVVLRKSYVLRSPYNILYCQYLTKNPDSSHYVLIGRTANQRMQAIEIKINVGSPNEYTLYELSGQFNIYGGATAHFDTNDKLMFRIIYAINDSSNNSVMQMYKAYNSTSYTTNAFYTFTSTPVIQGSQWSCQVAFKDENTCYFVNNTQTYGGILERYLQLLKHDFSTSTTSIIYNKYFGSAVEETLREFILIYNYNGEIYIQFNNNTDTTNYTADYYFQRLGDDTWNPILIGEALPFVYGQRTMFVKSNFNLLQIYLYATNPRRATWFQYLIKEDYNTLNYNGEPYIDYNSTVPYKAEIYSNNSLVFARNLYNLTTNANQSNATVVVPNSYLNGIDLTSKNLLSETNSEMVLDTNTTKKNIYETLYLNFINTTNVINEDTNTNYPLAAAYITENINTGTQENCETTTVGKIRLNKNGSSEIKNIYWETIDDTHKQTTIGITMAESVLSIDFISNDETTIYSTIDTSNLEVGNTYNITQSLRIE